MRTRSLHQVAPRHCQGASLLKPSLLDPFLSLIELATWKFHSCNRCLFELRATDVTRCPKICVNQGQTWCCLVVSRPTKKSPIFGYESPDPQKPQQCAAVNLQCVATRMSFGRSLAFSDSESSIERQWTQFQQPPGKSTWSRCQLPWRTGTFFLNAASTAFRGIAAAVRMPFIMATSVVSQLCLEEIGRTARKIDVILGCVKGQDTK